MLREHFGQYRLAARKTDMCSHCTAFHTKVVPAFKRFTEQVRAVSQLNIFVSRAKER